MGEERDGDVAAKAPPTKPSDSEKRKRRIPADWQPSERERTTAREKGLDCDAEAAHFRDHHTAKGESMLDWDAAFRTWLRNAVKFANRGGRQAALPAAPIRKEAEL